MSHKQQNVINNNNNNNNNNNTAGIPSYKEPHGLVRSDGKRPDGLTLVPWKGGKPLAWDVTAVCTVADSYVAATAREAGAAAERAAELKISKYSGLEDKCVFQPMSAESLRPLNETACQFLKDLGRRISAQSGDERESAFMFQRLSIVIQRFNAILLHNSFEAADHLG